MQFDIQEVEGTIIQNDESNEENLVMSVEADNTDKRFVSDHFMPSQNYTDPMPRKGADQITPGHSGSTGIKIQL